MLLCMVSGRAARSGPYESLRHRVTLVTVNTTVSRADRCRKVSKRMSAQRALSLRFQALKVPPHERNEVWRTELAPVGSSEPDEFFGKSPQYPTALSPRPACRTSADSKHATGLEIHGELRERSVGRLGAVWLRDPACCAGGVRRW